MKDSYILPGITVEQVKVDIIPFVIRKVLDRTSLRYLGSEHDLIRVIEGVAGDMIMELEAHICREDIGKVFEYEEPIDKTYPAYAEMEIAHLPKWIYYGLPWYKRLLLFFMPYKVKERWLSYDMGELTIVRVPIAMRKRSFTAACIYPDFRPALPRERHFIHVTRESL